MFAPLLLALTACGPATATSDKVGSDTGTSDTSAPLPDPPTDVAIRLSDTITSIAYVSWTQPTAGTSWVEWSLDGEATQSTPVVARAAGSYEQIVLGIPYTSTFTYRVVVANADGDQVSSDDASFTTGDPPADMPQPELLSSDPTQYDTTDPYILGSINACGWNGRCAQFWQFVLDRQGRLVWALLTPNNNWTLYVQPSQDGTSILWDEATYWSTFDGGAASQVHRMKIDGTIEASYATPGLHHSFLQLPDGTLVWGQANDPDENLEQMTPDGTESTIWSCKPLLQSLGVREDCQSNSLFYDEANDTFLFSFYTINSIIQIDHATGETLRYWGDLGGTFDPPEDQFSWQHGPSWLDNGDLMVSSYRKVSGSQEETVVYEYAIDDTTDTLTTVWSAGIGEGVYGDTNGEAHRLANGDTLHNMGTAGRLREWTPDDTLVWDVSFGNHRLLGHTLFVHDLYDYAP